MRNNFDKQFIKIQSLVHTQVALAWVVELSHFIGFIEFVQISPETEISGVFVEVALQFKGVSLICVNFEARKQTFFLCGVGIQISSWNFNIMLFVEKLKNPKMNGSTLTSTSSRIDHFDQQIDFIFATSDRERKRGN